MPSLNEMDCRTKEYWEQRVKERQTNLDEMIFVDTRRKEFWVDTHEYIKTMLRLWPKATFLDVACGYGKFCEYIPPEQYVGVDFCEGMLKIAQEKYPHHKFILGDANFVAVSGHFDVIFEVNSLKSLGMEYEQFFERYKTLARLAVACFECEQTRIKRIYPN